MRRLSPVCALLLALVAPDAGAVEPVLALRVGAGAAVGSAARSVPMGDAVPVQFPVQLDALVRGGPWAVGAYGSLGVARAGVCGGGATCSAWAARAGLQATFSPATTGEIEPWLGVASGYEWASEDRTLGGTVTTRWRGLEPVALQGGVEWRLGRYVALGPYALAALGRYDRYTVDTGLERATVRIADPALHAWFQVGVRGRLVLGGAR